MPQLGQRPRIRPRLFEVLGDGAWHSLGELYSVAGHLIQPEHAIRRYRLECDLADSRRKRRPAPAPVLLAEQIYRGRLLILRQTLYLMHHAGVAEIERRGRRYQHGVQGEYRLLKDKRRRIYRSAAAV